MHLVLLFYKYTPIADPQDLVDQQKALCQRLGIKGRILVSKEGINGTASGDIKAAHEYMAETGQYPGLGDIDWKISSGPEDAFPKLRVVQREEIVTLGLTKQQRDVCLANKANYIEPQELHDLYQRGEEFFIVDARNNYEAKIGKFKNAITFDIENFREFPEASKQIENLKNKTVVTYCTGGIRCEKASAFLKEQGFKNVRQLHGGVHRYSEQTGGEFFEGQLYVFDKRVQMPVNTVDPSVISECEWCGQSVARYVDCCNDLCGGQFICCQACEEQHGSACCEECKSSPKKRKNLVGTLKSAACSL